MKQTLILLAVILSLAVFLAAQAPNNARMLSTPNAQTGTTYTFVAADTTRITTFSNANPVAATLPNGATLGFGAGTMLSVVNLGAGAVTITCSSCTINGAGTLILSQNQGADLYGGIGVSAVNYVALASPAGSNIAILNAPNTFTAANSFTSGISVSGGTAAISSPMTLTGTDSGNQTVSGNKTWTGANTVNSNGALTVTGTGAVNINGGGVINVANQSDLVLLAGGGIRATPGGASNILIDGSPPTITSGFGTSPSIAVNTSLAFTITIGSGGTANSGVIGFGNSATNGWNVFCQDLTTFSTTVFVTRQTATGINSATIGNFNTAAAAQPWAAGDVLSCMAAGR